MIWPIIIASLIGFTVFLLTVNEPVYNLFEIPPHELLLEIQPHTWPQDPIGGIIINATHDPGTLHEYTVNGTVTRGTYNVTDGTRTREYIYANFTNFPNSQCRESMWYSWVWPTIELETNGVFVPKTTREHIKAATGHVIKFNDWNPDYQKDWVDKENRKRIQQGKPPLPQISPDGVLPPSYPYAPFDTPAGKGFLDSPSFSGRNAGGSAAEKIFRDITKLKDNVESPNPPPNSIQRMKIQTHGHTYLYCVSPVKCLGWFEWDSTEIYTISVQWVQSGIALGNDKKWSSGTTISSVSTISMQPWQTCS